MYKVYGILLTGILSLIGVSLGYDQTYIDSLPEYDRANIKLIQNVNPSVVTIAGKENAQRRTVKCFLVINGICVKPSANGSDQSVVESGTIDIVRGSGFFLSRNGYILTNKHVVNDPSLNYEVTILNGNKLPAKVVAIATGSDLALIKIDGNNYTPLKLGNSDNIMIGQTVFAIGNTLGQYQNTVTMGIISGLNRTLLAGGADDNGGNEIISNAIQTDASINLGNSGGPLIDSLGNVIGINTAVDVGGQNIGFATPSNDIISFLKSYISKLSKK